MSEEQKETKEIIYVPAGYPGQEDEDEIDLLELWSVLWQGRWFVAALSFVCVAIAVIAVMFILPEVYSSNAVILLTSKDEASPSRLQSLASRLPIDVGLGDMSAGGESQNVVTFLNSRDFRLGLVKKYDLLPKIYKDKWNAEKEKWEVEDPEEIPTYLDLIKDGTLKELYTVKTDEEKPNLITISYKAEEDPQFAELMVERILSYLRYYLENEYKSDFTREKEFIKSQLEKARQEMEYWDNQVPSADMTLDKIQRERTVATQIYTEFRKQFEQAKITEAKEKIRFKVLDKPYLPLEPSKPNKKLICALSLVTSAFAGIFIVFFRKFIINARKRME